MDKTSQNLNNVIIDAANKIVEQLNQIMENYQEVDEFKMARSLQEIGRILDKLLATVETGTNN